MSLVVRVVAPTGRDSDLIVSLLHQNGMAAEPCDSLATLLQKGYDIGPILLAEESLTSALIASLSSFVHSQPPWSDLPILILTTSGRETESSRRMQRERLPLGSPVLLERPIRTATLVSSVQAAVRARRRQYEVRSALEERDRVAQELRAEQEVLRVILDNMPVGVILAKSSGEVVLGNSAVERIFRHPILPTADFDEHGKWVSFHADGTRVAADEYPLVRAIQTGEPVPGEDLLYQRGDGTQAWVRLSAAPVRDANGHVTGGVVTVSDIDDEKRAAELLRRSSMRFRMLVEKASVGVVIGELDGRLNYINPSLLHTLGYTEDEVRQGFVRWDSLTPPEYAAADARAIEQLQATGVAEPYQKAYLDRQGRPVPLLVGAVRIPSQHADDREEIAVFMTDLSVQKQAEAALVQSEKLAAVGRLAASISHEINNPLEAVTNLLYLATHEDLSPQAHTYLEQASQELARVSQIAGQTLRFHRQSTRPRSVTPQELMAPVLALYQGRMVNAQVEAMTDYRGEPRFVCYEGDIRQVLNNLVGNAIDAMRGKGVLRVRSHAATHPVTGIPGVRITVADDGHGMSRETLQNIFEPFYTTKGIHGTGLGLWISKGIVVKHHGVLSVRSRTAKTDEAGADHGTGTVFSLFLPQNRELSGRQPAESASV